MEVGPGFCSVFLTSDLDTLRLSFSVFEFDAEDEKDKVDSLIETANASTVTAKTTLCVPWCWKDYLFKL